MNSTTIAAAPAEDGIIKKGIYKEYSRRPQSDWPVALETPQKRPIVAN